MRGSLQSEYERATLLGKDGELLRHDHGLEYALTGCGAVVVRDAPFAARHPSFARLLRSAGALGMWFGALNPGLAFAGQQHTPIYDSDVAVVETEQAGTAVQHRVRRHLGRAAPAPQLAYIVPISDQTELGIANLDTVAASIAVYSGGTPTILDGNTWLNILTTPELNLEEAVPVNLTLPAGGFARMIPQTSLYAAISVGGANPDLVQVIAQHTHTVNGHILTETVPATRLGEMIPAGGTGYLPGPADPAHFGDPVGVLQGVIIISGHDATAFDLMMESLNGGLQLSPIHIDLDPRSSRYIPDIWKALNGQPSPDSGLYYLKVQPTSGAVAVYDLLTDTASGKHTTLLAAQDNGEIDFLFPVQRRFEASSQRITEAHAIYPAAGRSSVFLPLLQQRDSNGQPMPSIKLRKQVVGALWHGAWSDVVSELFLPQTSYGVDGFIAGHGAIWDSSINLSDFVDGPHVPLFVWGNQRIIKPYGDVGQWMPALYASDACGGSSESPCSTISITPLTRILLSNASADSLPINIEFYDSSAKISTEQRTLRQNENVMISGIIPPGAVRLVTRAPAGNTGAYYLVTQTPTAGDCEDYQAGKPLPNR